MLGEKDEGRKLHYIIHRGEMFLDKCDAFSALGRLYIVRCADYRKADRIITSNGMKPAEEYLYESAARQILEATNASLNVENVGYKIDANDEVVENDEKNKIKRVTSDTSLVNNQMNVLKQRKKFNRRTHITLKAFKVLVESGFTDSSRNEFLRSGVEGVYSQKDHFLSQCTNRTLGATSVTSTKSKYQIKEEVKPNPAKRKCKALSNPSSSSGIESGNSSDIESNEGSESNTLPNIIGNNSKETTTAAKNIKTGADKDCLKNVNPDRKSGDDHEETKPSKKLREPLAAKNKKQQNVKQPEKGASIHSCRLLGRDVSFIIMYEEVYLDLKAISNFFPSCNNEKCTTPALLRKKSKHLHFEHPPFFPPRRFTKHSTNYVSLNCLATLISKDLISPIAGKKNQLLDDFKLILSNEEVSNPSSHERKLTIVNESIKEETIDHSRAEKKEGQVPKRRKKSTDEKPVIPTKRHKPSMASNHGIKNTSSVNILGTDYEIQVSRNTIFLDKVAIFQLFKVSKSYHKHSNSTYRNIDRLLDRAKLSPDEAFLFEGRKRKFISIQALTILIEQDFLQLLEDNKKCGNDSDDLDTKPVLEEDNQSTKCISPTQTFLARLVEIEKSSSLLENKQTLRLPSFNKIEFRPANQTLYLKTLHYMQAVGFSTNYVYRDSPSKAYFVLARLLKSRGLNLNACFLQHHKAKYGYISVYAAMVLFKTDFGPFKDKKRILRLKKELNNALTDQGFVDNGKWVKSRITKREVDKEGSPGECSADSSREGTTVEIIPENYKYIQIGPSKFKYRIKGENKLFIHRKSCFEAIGIEQSILSCTRGYTSNRGFSGINNILKAARIDTDKCYLKGKQEQYAYISLEAVMVLLDSEDPLLVCLENKQDFADALLSTLQEGIANILQDMEDETELFPINYKVEDVTDQTLIERKIPFKFERGKIFLRRDICYELSGILEKRQTDNKQKSPIDSNAESTGIHLESSSSSIIKPKSETENEAQIIADRGLDVSTSFCKDGEDDFAYVSINALLVQTSLDGEISKVTDWTNSSKFFGLGIWTDLIAAISHEAPKLKIHVKMIEFREQLLHTILMFFIKYLNKKEKEMRQLCLDEIKKETSLENQIDNIEGNDESKEIETELLPIKHIRHSKNDTIDRETIENNISFSNSIESATRIANLMDINADKMDENDLRDGPIEATAMSAEEDMKINPESILEMNMEDELGASLIPTEVFNLIRKEIQESCRTSEKNIIGDWLVERCDEQEIMLVVNPGYGGSRKMSFIQPDVWAILRYQLIFSSSEKPKVVENQLSEVTHHLRLFINEKQVPSDLVLPVLTKSIKKGVFNLLYNLLILRPCFGSFNPELVETFAQVGSNVGNGMVGSMICENKTLDTNFIGSSQNGRTYAGTVRSTDCRILASARISDTCEACSHLHSVTINRSILNTPAVKESKNVGLAPDTKGDCKIAETQYGIHSENDAKESGMKIESGDDNVEVEQKLPNNQAKREEAHLSSSSNRSSVDGPSSENTDNNEPKSKDSSKRYKSSEEENIKQQSASHQV